MPPGHPKRLDRFSHVKNYLVRRHASEELVAEFGAAFLCATTRTWSSAVETRQAAYIRDGSGPSEAIRPRLVRVLADAQRAAEFILGRIPIVAERLSGTEPSPSITEPVPRGKIPGSRGGDNHPR